MKPASPYDILFEPVPIGPVVAPNRFYAVPHATGHGHLQPNGAIALRGMKARGGWGVVAAQMTEIGADTDMANHPMDRIWDERDLPVHQRQVEIIKQHGALAAIEIAHGGLRARNMTTGQTVQSPSDLPILRPDVPGQGRAMTRKDIKQFRYQHKRAAKAAKDAGFDIIYVYAAHDLSLLSHFLSRRVNHRSDEYGGSLENRVRLLREVLQDTVETVGDKCAVALRFSVAEPGEDQALCECGEGREVVEMLANIPDLWDVNISTWSADSATSRYREEGHQLEYMDFVKKLTNKPVVGVGRYTSPDKMVSMIKQGKLDLIGAARPSIADPFLPNKVRENRIDDIRECIGCNICVASDAYGIPLRCTQNPTIAEEWRRNWHPELVPKTRQSKNVLIVGAGPAGLECALTLGKAGHEVTLAERTNSLGGRVKFEAGLQGLNAWSRVIDYRSYQLERMSNVSIYLESDMDSAQVSEFEADHVFIATGSRWRRDGIGGSHFQPLFLPEQCSVLTPDQIDPERPPVGRVLVYDDDHNYLGGVLAAQLAIWGCEVNIITPLNMISSWTENTLEQGRVVQQLRDLGVSWHVNQMIGEIDRSSLQTVCAYTGENLSMFSFDHLLLLGGRLPQNLLYNELLARQISVNAIGDCNSPGTIQSAVYSGHREGRLFCGDELAGDFFNRDIAQLLV